MHGGLINTDAVDNSGGVDMSDHEVNIKILLDLLVRQGVIADRATRNAIIAEMTDEVSELVLADNINQSRALSLDGLRSAAAYDAWVDMVERFVADGIVDRADAALPSKAELLASPARDRGLPRPMLCVLMGHVKNWIFAQSLQTQVPDSDLTRPYLDAYFPKRIRQDFRDHLTSHPLKREIVATVAVNHVVNHAGIGLVARLMRETKADLDRVIMAYVQVDRACGATAVREALYAQQRPIKDELDGLLAIEQAIQGTVRDMLERRDTNPALTLQDVRAGPHPVGRQRLDPWGGARAAPSPPATRRTAAGARWSPRQAVRASLESAGNMAHRLKILYLASEAAPFTKTGGLADVTGSLPKAMAALGHDVRVVLPAFAPSSNGRSSPDRTSA